MGYEVYKITESLEGTYARLEIVGNHVQAFEGKTWPKGALEKRFCERIASPLGMVYINPVGFRFCDSFAFGVSPYLKIITIPNWFEKLLGITFRDKYKTSSRRLRRIIKRLYAKQIEFRKISKEIE